MDEMKIKSWLSNENKLSNTKIRSVGVIMCGSSLAWDLSNSSVAPTSASKPYVCAKCRRSFPNEGARSRHYNAQESCSPYVRLEICFKPIDMSKQNWACLCRRALLRYKPSFQNCGRWGGKLRSHILCITGRKSASLCEALSYVAMLSQSNKTRRENCLCWRNATTRHRSCRSSTEASLWKIWNIEGTSFYVPTAIEHVLYGEREDDIKKSKNNSDAAFAKRKRLRGGGRGEKIPELGNELVQLINNNRSKGLRVDSDYVKQRALGYVATHYPELFESFKRSSTLLTRLRNVFKFSIRKVTHTKVVAIHDKLPGVRRYLAELRARLKYQISINTPIHSPDGAILIMNRFNAEQVYWIFHKSPLLIYMDCSVNL